MKRRSILAVLTFITDQEKLNQYEKPLGTGYTLAR